MEKNHLKNNQKNSKVLILIPCYNNDATIASVLNSILAYGYKPLVINDGSTDTSRSRIISYGSKLHYIEHERNLGKGAAIMSGYRYAVKAGYTHIITFDADGQHLASEIEALLTSAPLGSQTIVVGSRGFDQSAGDVPSSSKFGRFFSNFWVMIETGQWLPDTQSGMRLYPANPNLFNQLKHTAYDFEIEILVKAAWLNFSIQHTSVKVYYPPRQLRVSHFDGLKDNLKLSLLHTQLTIKSMFYRLNPKHKMKPLNLTTSEKPGLQFSSWLFNLGGQSLCYLTAIFPTLFYYIGYPKERKGIADLYQRLGYSKFSSQLFSFRNFWFFALSLIDRIAIFANTQDSKSLIQAPSSSSTVKNPAVFVGSHFGDWLLCSVGLGMIGPLKIAIIIDKESNPNFNKLVARIVNPSFKIVSLKSDHSQSILQLKNLVDEGFSLGFMTDRPSDKRNSLECLFMGSHARFSTTPFRIAKALKCPIYSFSCYKVGLWPKSPYRFNFKPIADSNSSDYTATLRNYLTGLEDEISSRPSHWFNFYAFWTN